MNSRDFGGFSFYDGMPFCARKEGGGFEEGIIGVLALVLEDEDIG
jgi:hypothetical protein